MTQLSFASSTAAPALQADFAAARGGDAQAFARLVSATQRMVASVALAVTRDVQLSEDIAQETYLKAWRKLGDMQHAESLLPWLRQVTRHLAIDHLRRRRHQPLALLPDDPRWLETADAGPEPDAAAHADEQAVMLAAALDAIPDDSRETLLLFYREGQSSRQVASLLGLSDAAVRKRLQRAREALQSEMLSRVGEISRHSAPSLAFTASVVAMMAGAPAQAAAATATVGGATAAKWTLGALGSAMAAFGLVLGAVAWEVRSYVVRARNPVERRELLVHGAIYAAVMASFVGMLFWFRQGAWGDGRILAVSAVYAVIIIGLGVRRHFIHRRHRG